MTTASVAIGESGSNAFSSGSLSYSQVLSDGTTANSSGATAKFQIAILARSA